jgi:hypothetical protein
VLKSEDFLYKKKKKKYRKKSATQIIQIQIDAQCLLLHMMPHQVFNNKHTHENVSRYQLKHCGPIILVTAH